MGSNSNKDQMIVIIGAGLVGSAASCLLAKRGYKIKLFEMRQDIRTCQDYESRSINLAISERGQSTLRVLGLEKELIQNYAVSMFGRMIHNKDKSTRFISYGKKNQYIYSIGRKNLNEKLLCEIEKYENIQINFLHKLVSCNFEKGQIEILNSQGVKQVINNCQLIIGCDGAFSKIRREMMSNFRFNFSQYYIEHGYIELKIEPKDGNFALDSNYLHIWPRGTFMMIALPNIDKSFTLTLFMPFSKFESIKSAEDLISFFEKNFSDVIPLIKKENLVKTFFNAKPGNLVTVKCQPYNYKDKGLLLGDAAHAMVPFYGQGMNCGLEDCLILDQLLEKYGLSGAIQKFDSVRNQDAHSICDLALYNYIEMRDLVNSKRYLIRKNLDNFLNRLFPKFWIPLYTMVTFTHLPYSQCVKNRKIQDNIISFFFYVILLSGIVTSIYFYFY